MKTAKFVVNNIREIQHKDEVEYVFHCPVCDDEVSMLSFEDTKCKCGLRWTVSIIVNALGR